MNKKILVILLILLIGTVVCSHIFIPKKIEIDGGSCYQGITAGIGKFFLKICGILNLISLIALLKRTKFKTAKVLSIISVIIWSLWSFLIIANYEIEGFFYITPFLIITVLIVIANFKYPNFEN